ncbi:MAG: TonB-dependent receptor [Dysgonamonadaceae bacterium]|jgi:outer membrane receptor protein involved in Fe transport|nr:TonB-dependent receptor [Dysgonamonadaceae bacterium]
MKHRNFIYGLFLSIVTLSRLHAGEPDTNTPDSVQFHHLDEIVISASTKETNDRQSLPGSVSFITPAMIEGQKILHIKDLSLIIPNFFIPDYGSRLSVPVYIRGIGERSAGQSIGLYVDNAPYPDKSVFDFDFVDIQQIEVLRGPQGTLYGRNAMGGIVNLTTPSPLRSQQGKVSLTAGDRGLFRAKFTDSELLAPHTGISVSGYYTRNDGYFTNQFNGKRADNMESAGAKIRLDWKISPYWTAQWTVDGDISEQGAFPYGQYANGTISAPNYNYPGSYERQVAGSHLNLTFENESVIFNANTGFRYFDDDMKMDVDNSASDIFKLNQWQKEKAWTEELTLKSNTKSNYQWSFGIFGFYMNLKTRVTTTMGADGIETILQPVFDKISENNPRAPMMTVTNQAISIPGTFQTPVYGGAVFHQSTYNNLFIDGLSLTAGLRLDYEKTGLDYLTNMDVDLSIDRKAGNTTIHLGDSTLNASLQGTESMRFKEILPKIAVKYQLNPDNYVYATVSNGYKTGGYNIQHFADIIQRKLRGKHDPVGQSVPYRPEYSWNYETGFKGILVKNVLFTEVAVFYIDVADIQITDFVESGQGRILKNAGKARSAGFDWSLSALVSESLRVTANYGFTHAVFNDYIFEENGKRNDYSGNHIPFAPQNTLSISAVYNKNLKNKWLDRFDVRAQYHATGRIYWTEKNDVYQDFYGILNLRAGLGKGAFSFNVWTNNTLNTGYTTFYFESMEKGLAQKGKPFNFGADVSVTF